MKSKEAPRKVSCVMSELKLECSIGHRCIQEIVLQACGFTQGTPQLNVQVLLRGTSKSMIIDIACLDSSGAVIAELPAVAKSLTHDNKHSQAASFTQARTHACVLARQLQDSQADIKELMAEVAGWQEAASQTAAQLQQRDDQVSNLQQQLAKAKPRSLFAPKNQQQPSHASQAVSGAVAASDDIGHLHAEVENVETTIATLRALTFEQEQQLMQQQLQLQQQESQLQQQQQQPPEQCSQAAIKLLKQQLKHANLELKQMTEQLEKQKEQSMQLKRGVHERSVQLEKEQRLAVTAQAEAASSHKAHARVAQQLEEARAELSRQDSERHSKQREAKQQTLQDLEDVREQLSLQSQLLREQDQEVSQLRQLLEMEHEQMAAQERQQADNIGQLQGYIREQQQQAAVLLQAAALQEAEGAEQQKLVQKLSQHLQEAQQQVQQLTQRQQQHDSELAEQLRARQDSQDYTQQLLTQQQTCDRQEALLHQQSAEVTHLQSQLQEQQQLCEQQAGSIADLTERLSQLQSATAQQEQANAEQYKQLQQASTDLEQLLKTQQHQLQQQDRALEERQDSLNHKDELLLQQQQQTDHLQHLYQSSCKRLETVTKASKQAESQVHSQTDLLLQQEREISKQNRLLECHQQLHGQLSGALAVASAQADRSRLQHLEAMLQRLQQTMDSHCDLIRQEAQGNGSAFGEQQGLLTEASETEYELQHARTQMQQLKADLTLQKAITKEQKQDLGHKQELVSELQKELRSLTDLACKQRSELQALETQALEQQQQSAHHTHLLRQQQQALSEHSAAAEKLQQKLREAQAAAEQHKHAIELSSQAEQRAQKRAHQRESTSQAKVAQQLQTELQTLDSTVQQQQQELAEGAEAIQQLQQLLLDKEVVLSEQHEQLLQQDGLLRQQRELLVNQDTALQVYKGSASPRARWGHIHLQLAHRHAQARHRRLLAALFCYWLSECRRRRCQHGKLVRFDARSSHRCFWRCFTAWGSLAQASRMEANLQSARSAQRSALLSAVWYAWRGFSQQQALYSKLIRAFRRQQSQLRCRAVLLQWRAMSAAKTMLQQQGRSAARRLQALRLRQAWQLWRQAHRQALAARQRQYSNMVYELLKEAESSEAALHSKQAACQAGQHEVASNRLQLEASRERLVGVKERLGLSQEALLEEHEATLRLQLQAREDIYSADEAVQAVANMVHQLAPNGDLTMAAHALEQAQQMSKAVRSLPRSLAQWLPTTRQHSNPPASRLAHVLLRHFQPPQSGQQPHGYAASASSNPKMAPSAAAATTMQQQLQSSQALAKQKQGGGRKAARAASALLRGRDERSSAVAAAAMKAPAGPEIPTWVATRERPPSGRLPSPERRPQSAGSNAAPAAKGEPAAKGKTKPRARSTSPNSQYHFSCTSSVPDHGSSCFGEAASLALQDWSNTGKTQNDLRKGREPTQLPARQAGGATGPMHTTYVLSQQHEMLPKFMPDAKDIQQPRTEQKAESRQQQQQQQRRQQMRGDKFGSDVQEAAAAASLKTSPDRLQQPRGFAYPPDTPGGFSMAPPLEPPSTIKPVPAGVTWAALDPPVASGDQSNRPQLSPFLRRVAHQMQLELPNFSHRPRGDMVTEIACTSHQKSEQGQRPSHPEGGAATAAYTGNDPVSHAASHRSAQSQLTRHQDHAERKHQLQVPGQCLVTEPACPRPCDGLLGDLLASQQPPGKLAAAPAQHTYASLPSRPCVAGAHQQATAAHQCRQHLTTAHGKGSTTVSSSAGLSQQQHRPDDGQHRPDDGQRHSPSSRQSAVYSPHHGTASLPCSIGRLSTVGTSPSSQQASNSLKPDSRHVGRFAKPAALLVTQCAETGSSIRHGAESVRHEPPLAHAVPSQKLLDQLIASTSSGGRSASESGVPQGKEQPGPPGWDININRHAWVDEGTNSTTKSSSGSSSSSSSGSSSTLDHQCLGAVSSVHQTASQSMMVPLELPSPMPDSSSEDEDEATLDVFDAATGRPLGMESLGYSGPQLAQACPSSAGSSGEVDQTLCQVMVQQQKASSKSLRLPAPPLDLQQRGSSSTQIHQAPNASPWQSSPEKYLTKLTGMHAMHSGQAAIRVSSQPGGVKKPEGSLEGTPAAGGGKTAKALSGAEKRSPLKGSNAWPPASPSPKKGMLGRSQNRAPNVRSKGNFDMPGGVQQPGTDPLALLRSRSSGSSHSMLDR